MFVWSKIRVTTSYLNRSVLEPGDRPEPYYIVGKNNVGKKFYWPNWRWDSMWLAWKKQQVCCCWCCSRQYCYHFVVFHGDPAPQKLHLGKTLRLSSGRMGRVGFVGGHGGKTKKQNKRHQVLAFETQPWTSAFAVSRCRGCCTRRRPSWRRDRTRRHRVWWGGRGRRLGAASWRTRASPGTGSSGSAATKQHNERQTDHSQARRRIWVPRGTGRQRYLQVIAALGHHPLITVSKKFLWRELQSCQLGRKKKNHQEL